jgi:hypothetical protein
MITSQNTQVKADTHEGSYASPLNGAALDSVLTQTTSRERNSSFVTIIEEVGKIEPRGSDSFIAILDENCCEIDTSCFCRLFSCCFGGIFGCNC